MRISTKGRHAVMAMVDLARNGGDKPVSLAEVARRQEISLSYLEQLIARLKSSGLVKSIRGPGGGYRLSMTDDKINVYQIVHAVDDLAHRVHIDSPLTASGRQLTDLMWQSIGDEVNGYLKTTTLADVVQCSLCGTMSNRANEGGGGERQRLYGAPNNNQGPINHAA